MKEDIEKLLAHYQCKLLREQDEQTKDEMKIAMYQKFINELNQIIEKNEQLLNGNHKSKKHRNKSRRTNSEKILYIEPELVPRKRKQEG